VSDLDLQASFESVDHYASGEGMSREHQGILVASTSTTSFDHPVVSFTFLSCELRARLAKRERRNLFYSFLPALSRPRSRRWERWSVVGGSTAGPERHSQNWPIG